MQGNSQVNTQGNPGDSVEWSPTEQAIAQTAFKEAYQREISALIETNREQAGAIVELNDVWQLHDLLSVRRHEVEGKYDYRYSVLLFVFARLVKEGWLALTELKGLAPDKLAKISALTRM
jgi:hypothetical protein